MSDNTLFQTVKVRVRVKVNVSRFRVSRIVVRIFTFHERHS